MLTKATIQRLAILRRDDSILLLRQNRCSSAYYLSGYAIELAIKAVIASVYQADAIPDKSFVNATYNHNLESLMKVSGLYPDFTEDLETTPDLAANWAIVTKWSEQSRYEIWDPISTATMISAVAEPQKGVFAWVEKHW